MRKCICFAIIIIVLLFNGCYMKNISFEQSRINLMKYYTDIENIVQSYGYIIKQENNGNEGLFAIDYDFTFDVLSYGGSFIININKNSYIRIGMSNSNNTEKYYVDFNSELSPIHETRKSINIPLFVEIVNAISGKEITEELVEEFLNDPEDKYVDDWFKTYMVYKTKEFNFLSDWIMTYTLNESVVDISVPNDDLTEEFGMQGLTKQLEE